jgi:FAD/FMN-containing dehydrogenase
MSVTASWSNWSGNIIASPCRIETPASEQEIGALVLAARDAGLPVRVAGTGHSFTPIAATDGILLSLDDWKGVESHDAARGLVTVRAGTKLHDLGEDLLALGLAMENLGDVDVQSVGGATGTGTHGTGRTLRNLSAHVAGMRLVNGDGEAVDVREDSDPDLLRAARVSLGMLGVVSAVTLHVLPAFRLHERVWREPFAECMDRLDERISANVRYEFFWFPTSDEAECKTLNPTDLPPDPDEPAELAMGTPAGPAGTVRQPAQRERVGWSARIIPSVRQRKFNEMEYAVPAAAGPECFRQVRERMLERHPDVQWPVEYRTLAPDDAWLSPAYGRDTVTLSIHQDARLPYQGFFSDIEAIFRAHGGRPHWGKVHSCTAAELRDLYPEWDRFLTARARLDPAGRFLTPYLRGLLGGV